MFISYSVITTGQENAMSVKSRAVSPDLKVNTEVTLIHNEAIVKSSGEYIARSRSQKLFDFKTFK